MFTDEFMKWLELTADENIKAIPFLVEGYVDMMGRSDRITWTLWRFKLELLRVMSQWAWVTEYGYDAAETIPDFESEIPDKLMEKGRYDFDEFQEFAAKQLNKINKHLAPSEKVRDTSEFNKMGHNFYVKIDNFSHYLSLENAEIEALVFKKQSIDEILELFEEYEDNAIMAKDGGSRFLDDKREDWTVVLKLNENWVWYDINKSFCRDEGGAMAHCGNSDGEFMIGQTIYSLRELVKEKGKTKWKPHLTFIYHKDSKSFGEMKGYKNNPPSKKFHEYIVPLLELPSVQVLTGGGYKPQNNFKLSDLDQATVDRLIGLKPGLSQNSENLGLTMLWDNVKKYPNNRKKIESYILGEVDKGAQVSYNGHLNELTQFAVAYSVQILKDIWLDFENVLLKHGQATAYENYLLQLPKTDPWPQIVSDGFDRNGFKVI